MASYPPPSGYPPPVKGGEGDNQYPPPDPYGAPPQSYPPPGGYPAPNAYPPPNYPPPPGGNAYPPPNYPPPGQNAYPPPMAYPGGGQHPMTGPPVYTQQHGGQTTVISVMPISTIFGPYSTIAYCSHCKDNVSTKVELSIGCMVWLMFFIFCLICPILSCIPFCITTWYDASHYCPRCKHKLGRYSPM